MIFFVGNDGTVISSVPSPVYQGSVNANNIYLVAPFAANLQVTVAFKLPNGVWTTRYLMTPTGEITGVVNKQTGKPYAGWQFSMPNEITQYYGTVAAQFFFYAGQGVLTASSSTSFTVGKGVPEILPDTPSQDIYNQILDSLSLLSQQVNNGAFAARSIYAWRESESYGANEIVFYPDKGEYGVLVKSLEDKNSEAPYVDGVLNSAYWSEVTDFNILNDLYGLKTEVAQAAQSAQANATAAGQSAASAQSSAETATSAEARVENAAEYIEGIQEGTVSVPKAIADETGKNIANQFASVASDISGLRDDISNESHFRGMFDSVEALKAAYPTATPNDYAYIVGGNQYIYQNGEWTDSEQPSPNTAVPASNSTPLMDGEASPGNSAEYSRGDHRHPSDTNKADTNGSYPELTAGKADKLSTARNIDGVAFDGNSNIVHFGVCETAANEAEKVVQLSGFSLMAGAKIAVKFTYTNTTSAPTLNVNNTGAKPIYFPSSSYNAKNVIASNKIIEFIFDGTNWVMISGDPLGAYPVGSIYMSVNSTSPAELFGGSWARVAEGKTLYGAGIAESSIEVYDDREDEYYPLWTISYIAGTSKQPGIPNVEGAFRRGTNSELTVPYGGSGYTSGAFKGGGNTLSSAKAYGNSSSNYSGREMLLLDASNMTNNEVYGNSLTVQPAAYVVNMWRRTA